MQKSGYALLLLSILALTALGRLDIAGYVVDEAAMLTPAQKIELENILIDYEKSSTNQLAVVSLKSLDGKTIEDFAYQLGRKWGLGSKEGNNGVLLVIAPHERKVRIEVGYGLEDKLTDAASKLIIERLILPYFRKGEMAEGIFAGTRAIIQTLGGEKAVLPEEEKETPFMVYVIGLFIILLFIMMSQGPRPRSPSGSLRGPWNYSDRGGSSGSMGGRNGGGGSFGGGGASGGW